MIQTPNFGRKPEPVGSLLHGRYKIMGILGVGDYGNVYLARDLRFPEVQRMVAIKAIQMPVLAAEQEELALQRFEKRVKQFYLVSHPGIAHIIEWFFEKD
ncbi:MAG TPA: hypothetical protein VMT34_08895, partial [Aggregatilineales bacterium]|nr:hypothetical protein [Aggregatilineales bacterium]